MAPAKVLSEKRTDSDLRELNVNIAQNRHHWELSRAQFFRELVHKRVPPTDHGALDIGSGGLGWRRGWRNAFQLVRNSPA